MSLWRQLTRGLRVLTSRQADRELDEEIRQYFEHTETAARARGLSPNEARRAAQLEVGNLMVVREDVRSSGWEHVVGAVLADLRYTMRRLRRDPAFTVISVVTLAVGIGATAAIFSAVKGVLLEPLAYGQADRIVTVSDTTGQGQPLNVTFGTYLELVQRSRAFEALAPFKAWQPTLVSSSEPERLSGERVGAQFFRALGVSPAIGRDFQPDEDRPNGPKVAIVSDRFWRRRFAADPSLVGRSITLDDAQFLVIGVMPRGFENVLTPTSEIWTPLQYNTVFSPQSREWGHHLRLIGRLREGATLDAARRELDEIAAQRVPEFERVPWALLSNGMIARSLQAEVTAPVRPALLAVLGAVVLLLVIACVNVTNLLLARSAQRRDELAMRVALGAGRGRLFRQLLTESVLLSLIGGALAVFVAAIAVRTLVGLAPPELPRVAAIRLDRTIFVFALMLATIVGTVIGLIPALQATRQHPQAGTQGTSRRTTRHHGTRRLLVVAEVAIALVLLTGAGLLLRSVQRVFAAPVGFDPSGLLTMQVQQSGPRYRIDTARYNFYTRALDAIREVPGVSAAAFTSLMPLDGSIDVYGVHFERDSSVQDDGAAMRYAVTPDYFAVMGIPLRSGRLLNAHDTANAPRAVVISEAFARRKFPDGDAIGQRLRFGPPDGEWFSVVGVVADVKQSSLDVSPSDSIYVAVQQWHWVDPSMTAVLRGRGDMTGLVPAIRRAIWSVDNNVPIVRIATMDTLVERAIADRRFALVLFEAFGIAALVLVTTGIYGVLSGSVTERKREIGVRSALGATRREIVGLVLRDGLLLATVGIMLGLAGAVASSGALATLLFGVSHLDPATYGAVVVLLLGASAIACSAPAYRAASIDPSITLRAE